MARVVLAMSGGVDSSVAAWLLKEQGHEVIGVFLRHGLDLSQAAASCPADESQVSLLSNNPPEEDVCRASSRQGCCSAADAADARRVAELLDMPFYAVNFQQDFEEIVNYFVAEYAAGRTPNPCIVCNTRLKFGRLFEYANAIGADFVATGHHARVTALPDGGLALLRGRDPTKDQSYALFGIPRRLLTRLLLPVGEHTKPEIRCLAEKLKLPVAAKRDSQEICFVPDDDYAGFVRRRLDKVDTSGEIVNTDGTVLGRHDGIERFTIGQRKGLRLAFGERRYVVRIEAGTCRIVIGTREELARTELSATGANWLLEPQTEATGESQETALASAAFLPHNVRKLPCWFQAEVKIRYRSPAVESAVELLPEGRFRVRFARPCFGITPGQAAVCYAGERVLGGGWIE